MTGIERPHGGVPDGPPWSVDLLADLHAGALEDSVAAQLWPRVRADAEANAVLDALDATTADLATLADLPTPRMPDDVAVRIEAALAEEARAAGRPVPAPAPTQSPGIAPVVDIGEARRRRNRRLGWGSGILVAAAAAVGLIVAVLPGTTPSPGTGVAAPPPGSTGATPPEALTSGQLDAGLVSRATGKSDYGPFGDPAKRSACLAANRLDPDETPAGGMQVTLDGRRGTLMVLPTGKLAQFRLLVVGPDCSAGHPSTIADTVIGGISGLPVPPPTR